MFDSHGETSLSTFNITQKGVGEKTIGTNIEPTQIQKVTGEMKSKLIPEEQAMPDTKLLMIFQTNICLAKL